MVLWCKSGLCPHTWYTSSPVQSHQWFNECSPQTGKNQDTVSNRLHMANYCPTFRVCTPLTQVPHVPKSLPRALRNIRHLREWSTALKVGAVRHSEIKFCKKGFKKHTQKTNHYWIICVACYNAQALFLPQLWYAQNKEWNWWRLKGDSHLWMLSKTFRFQKMQGNFLTSWELVSFSRTLLHRVRGYHTNDSLFLCTCIILPYVLKCKTRTFSYSWHSHLWGHLKIAHEVAYQIPLNQTT